LWDSISIFCFPRQVLTQKETKRQRQHNTYYSSPRILYVDIPLSLLSTSMIIEQECIRQTGSSTTGSISANSSDEQFQTYKTPIKQNKRNDQLSSSSQDTSIKASITPLDNIPYIHRGFAGAAPFFIQDEKWMRILHTLMPDEYTMLQRYLKVNGSKVDPIKVIKWAENNPIVCAFGVLESDTSQLVPSWSVPENPPKSTFTMAASRNVAAILEKCPGMEKCRKKKVNPTIEWDVFLDPSIVKQVDAAIHKMEQLDSTKVEQEEFIAAQIEIDRQVSRLVNRMMLAHGSTAQLLVEAVGVATRYSFSQFVKSTNKMKTKITKKSKTFARWKSSDNQNGVYHPEEEDLTFNIEESRSKQPTLRSHAIRADRWLVLFSKALKLGKKSAEEVYKLTDRVSHIQTQKEHKSSEENKSVRSKTSRFLRRTTKSPSYDEDEASLSTSVSTTRENQEFVAPALCGLFLCLGMDDPNSFMVDHSDITIAESAQMIRNLLGSNLQLVLDMKSRHVPPRVWAMLVDCLQSRGLIIKGIGSFDLDELRAIQALANTPVDAMIFFHSAGDLQRACHANEIRLGDTVYFNAGSLMWKRKTACEVTGQCFSTSKYQGLQQVDSKCDFEYSPFQPYAYPRQQLESSDDIMDCMACIQDYQKHFDLNIGLYLHEFDIGVEEIDVMSKFVNRHSDIYRLGLAWGGLNGYTLRELKGDGLWSQRYVGRAWDFQAKPQAQMTLLAPEDHHLVQRIAFPCGNVATTNHMDEDDTFLCQHGPILDFTKTGNL
jgi:hypothetical protein